MAFRGRPPMLSNAAAGKKKTEKPTAITRRPALGEIASNALAGPKTVALRKIPPTKIVKQSTATENDNLTEQFETLKVESYSSQRIPDIENIDEGDEGYPHLVAEWVNEIYDYLRHLETIQIVREDYWKGNDDLHPRMRTILVNWLYLVHTEFKLLPETLYLTVAILDRTLQDLEVRRSKLQLIGATALMIACKYEEMLTPEMDDYFRICKEMYPKSDIRRMECVMLRILDYSLGRPLVLHFVRRNSKAGHSNAQEHTMAKYFLELSLFHYDLAHYPPSLVGAAALCLTFKLLRGSSSWTDTLIYHSKYTELELRPVMKKLAVVTIESEICPYQAAVRVKYTSPVFYKTTTSILFKSREFKRFANGQF